MSVIHNEQTGVSIIYVPTGAQGPAGDVHPQMVVLLAEAQDARDSAQAAAIASDASADAFSGAASGAGWHLDGMGLPQDTGITAAGTNKYGQDYYYQCVRDLLCVLSGGAWNNSSDAGAWSADLGSYRTYAGGHVGFRAASYLPSA